MWEVHDIFSLHSVTSLAVTTKYTSRNPTGLFKVIYCAATCIRSHSTSIVEKGTSLRRWRLLLLFGSRWNCSWHPASLLPVMCLLKALWDLPSWLRELNNNKSALCATCSTQSGCFKYAGVMAPFLGPMQCGGDGDGWVGGGSRIVGDNAAKKKKKWVQIAKSGTFATFVIESMNSILHRQLS